MAATHELRDLVAQIAAIGPEDLRAYVVFGAPGRQLRKLAASENAYMIVVGPRRHGALLEALGGSPVRRLLRRGESPVMVCPRPASAFLADGTIPRTAGVSP